MSIKVTNYNKDVLSGATSRLTLRAAGARLPPMSNPVRPTPGRSPAPALALAFARARRDDGADRRRVRRTRRTERGP